MTPEEVVQQAQDAGVRLVRFLYCDNGCTIRGKTTHVSRLADRMQSGIGLTVAMQAMNMLDQLQPVEGMGPVGEIRLMPDPDTFVILPYAPNSAAMNVDMLKLDGTPWEACPRSFLKRMIKQARDHGIRLRATFENEFSLATRDEDGRYVPYDETLCFSSISMTLAGEVMDAIVAALEAQDIEVEQYYPELGHGQQELSISPADALTAADNQIKYRETVRGVAAQYELYASLAPKPWPDQAGNGAHIHFSLWDSASERNLLYDPSNSDPYRVSQLGYHFIGGVLRHLPGLLALTAPSYNSYRRLQPQFWSSAYTVWGPDNREAAVRIPSPFRGSEESSVNFELKPSDPSNNPYLALGGLIAAGLDGMTNEIDPGEPVLVDPHTIPAEERERRGICRFPENQKEALDALEGDQVLMEALGVRLAESYLAVKRSEWKAFSENDVDFEIKHHFYKF